MPMDYYTWLAVGPAGAFVIDTGFCRRDGQGAQARIPALPGGQPEAAGRRGRKSWWAIVQPRLARKLILATSSQRPMTAATRALTNIVRGQVRELVRQGLWQPGPMPTTDRLPLPTSA